MLSRDFESIGDASGGPLGVGDVGIILSADGDTVKLAKVADPSRKQEGRTWNYRNHALVLAKSSRQMEGAAVVGDPAREAPAGAEEAAMPGEVARSGSAESARQQQPPVQGYDFVVIALGAGGDPAGRTAAARIESLHKYTSNEGGKENWTVLESVPGTVDAVLDSRFKTEKGAAPA